MSEIVKILKLTRLKYPPKDGALKTNTCVNIRTVFTKSPKQELTAELVCVVCILYAFWHL